MTEVYCDFPKSLEVNVGMILIQPLQVPQLVNLNICLAVLSDTTCYVRLQVWSRDFENLCILHASFNSCPQDNVFKNPQHKLTTKNFIRMSIWFACRKSPILPYLAENFFTCMCLFTVYVRHCFLSDALFGACAPVWCKYTTGDNSSQSVHSCYNYRFFTKGLSLILRKFYKQWHYKPKTTMTWTSGVVVYVVVQPLHHNESKLSTIYLRMNKKTLLCTCTVPVLFGDL